MDGVMSGQSFFFIDAAFPYIILNINVINIYMLSEAPVNVCRLGSPVLLLMLLF